MKLICAHNTDKSPVKFKSMAQDIEPHGVYYIVLDKMPGYKTPGWVYKEIEFINPLIVEYNNTGREGWKNDISIQFKAKGRKLSLKLINAGFDAIITKSGNEYNEIVSLQEFNVNHKSSKRKTI